MDEDLIESYIDVMTKAYTDGDDFITWYSVLGPEMSIHDLFEYIMNKMIDPSTLYAKRTKYYKMLTIMYPYCEEAQKKYAMPDYTRGMPFTERIVRRDAKRLEKCVDGIDYDAPDAPGLYFIGETHFNPATDEKYYWVKIGESDNLRKRMNHYNTSNPMLWRIGYKVGCNNEEKAYHERLRAVAVAKGVRNDEWFLVDRDTYLAMCEKGFRYFEGD